MTVSSDSVPSAETLLDQIHAQKHYVAFQTIYCKLHDIAFGLLDGKENWVNLTKEVLELMEYTRGYTENL